MAEKNARVYRVQAIVLRRVNVGETDRILTLLTRERGKLSSIAKGARGPKSRIGGATEPFTLFEGLLSQGQTLEVLTQAEVREAFPAIRKDLMRIGYASHFLEIVDAGTEDRQVFPQIWDLLAAALTLMESAETPDVLCRAFELHAMALFGYEPELGACVLDEQPLDLNQPFFHPLRGGMLCPRCAHRNHGSIGLQRQTLESFRELGEGPFIAAAHSTLPERVRGELARCMVPYLRHHLEAPLRSLQYLDDVTAPSLLDPCPTPHA